MSYEPTVIDLSHWQTLASLEPAKDAGVLGVIHKATEGLTYNDPVYSSRQQMAADAGLPFAAYHFLKHGEAGEQMAHFLDVVDLADGARMVIDYEDAACTLDDLREAVQWLFDHAPDKQVTVYGGALLKEQLGNACDPLLAQTSLWIAQYTGAAEPKWPEWTWPVWTLWQYSDACLVPGIDGPVDGNRFNGDDAALIAWLTPTSAAPVQPPQPLPQPGLPVVVSISAPPGVQVKVMVNGLTVME